MMGTTPLSVPRGCQCAKIFDKELPGCWPLIPPMRGCRTSITRCWPTTVVVWITCRRTIEVKILNTTDKGSGVVPSSREQGLQHRDTSVLLLRTISQQLHRSPSFSRRTERAPS
eukprot:GSA120T00016888001.1